MWNFWARRSRNSCLFWYYFHKKMQDLVKSMTNMIQFLLHHYFLTRPPFQLLVKTCNIKNPSLPRFLRTLSIFQTLFSSTIKHYLLYYAIHLDTRNFMNYYIDIFSHYGNLSFSMKFDMLLS